MLPKNKRMEIINVDTLKKRMDAGEKLNIIDVREPSEYADFNIGATLIPLGKIMAMDFSELEELKNQEIICHCLGGSRSMQACMILESAGFKNTKNLEGGMRAWVAAFGK